MHVLHVQVSSIMNLAKIRLFNRVILKLPNFVGQFQMVCNSYKSRLRGIGNHLETEFNLVHNVSFSLFSGAGGLLEGEPRSSDAAWNLYQQWIVVWKS